MNLGLTQKYVAYKVGVSQQAVVRWESGITAPSASHLTKLAKVYECSIEELLDS